LIKRTVFYSGFAGFVIGFFAHVTLNPLLEFLSPAEVWPLGANQYRVALIAVAPINGATYAIVGAIIACSIRLIIRWKTRKRQAGLKLKTISKTSN
jgi:hypothetical protein